MKQEEDSATELRFPAGLRVLVVDDDNTCLKLMYTLLRKCQYYVTTTNRAEEALRILKERENSYDIVITDYEMPEIDGIKLLQLVGLEMSIPVIMLSSYSDTNLVMKGIQNGACDYLVKPVRIQELQNIWQHVVRRNRSITLRTPPPLPAFEDDERVPTENNAVDVRGKSIAENSRRGDEEEDDDDKDDSPTPKKPRLFWSVDLHQKFVDAVNSIGIEKAFPKKILDIMNVPGLTREKVASHLQKYRLYLRRMNSSDMAASKISAYEDGLFGGGYGVYRSLSGGTSRFPGINPALSHQPMYGQLNANSGLSIRGLASSPMLQTSQISSSSTPFGKFEHATPSPNPNATLFQGYSSQQQKMASFLFPTQNSIMSNQIAPQNESSSSMGAFDGTGGIGSNLLDFRCPPNWGTSSVHPPAFQHNNLFTSNISANSIAPPPMASMQNPQNDPLSFLCGFSCADSLNGNLQTQDSLNGNNVSSFNYMGQQKIWQDNRHDYLLDSLISPVPPADQNVSQSNINTGASPFNPPLEGTSSQIPQQNDVGPNMKLEDFLLDDSKLIASSSNGGSEYLEDIVGRFLKQDNGEMTQAGDDFDLDPFSV